MQAMLRQPACGFRLPRQMQGMPSLTATRSQHEPKNLRPFLRIIFAGFLGLDINAAPARMWTLDDKVTR
jgi:hypothetical protein